MDRRFGFDQGFETYDDSFARWYVPGRRVMEQVLAWLDGLEPDETFLLYVHTIDTHMPYPALTWDEVEETLEWPPLPHQIPASARGEIAQLVRLEGPRPPGQSLPAKRRVLRRAYDKGVEIFDADFGALLAGLDSDPRRDETAVIVTSDHGEALYTRGYGGHSKGLYESELAVPFAARLPGARPAQVDCRVGLIDVMPTLCSWLGLQCPSVMAGSSFFADAGARPAGSETYRGEASVIDPAMQALYSGPWKLIHQPSRRPEPDPPPGAWSLFHLEDDPEERTNLLADSKEIPEIASTFRKLRSELSDELPRITDLEPADDAVPLDAELEQRLRSLGYLE